MKTVKRNKLIVFLIVSMGIVFLLQWFPTLRVPLIILHIILLFLFNWKTVKFDTVSIILISILFYSVFQGLFLQKDLSLLKYLQAFAIMILYILYSLYSNAIASSINTTHLRSLSTFILILFGFFLISFSEWNLRRSAGLMGNPNITAHNLVMLLPLSLFLKRGKAYYFVLLAIILYGLLSFGSRSAILAIALGFVGFLFFKRIKASNKKSFMIISYLCLSVFLSYKSLDLLNYYIREFDISYGSTDSHLLYLGYNGRDLLREQALTEFSEGNKWLGASFEGGKLERISEDGVLSVHDGFIEILVRLGYVGSFLFFILILSFVYLILRIQNQRYQAVALMSFVSLLSLSTNSSTFFVFNYYYFFFILTLSIAYYSNYNSKENAIIKI